MKSSDKAVPSPCVGVCRLDDSGGTCVGCRRTLDEIAAWSSYDAARKEQVWQRLLSLPLPVRRKTCAACGLEFTCGAGGETGGCWCMDLPHELPVLEADGDCLCPSCLQKRAAVERRG
ncbi:cysteine-rich CWC family protein [Chromobacterium sp. IIBBL 290-4]|uniref:cysteine-rich CWC family protein n=1 Tax=Chromobacterium sp. IIBBL 290-4 TaxID=2953890 RepID=UPI0020B6B386|nr:cysteine-rich CWC family protein [Chromobacterium sp. IIBBL 290-4]UTH74524.1 cysteine-rich CWC family protein [Chromobacterium sp. IIBBL 290-4]